MRKWYEQSGKNSDIVISSRIRLARNLEGYPFAGRLEGEQAAQLVNSVTTCFENDFGDEYSYLYMSKCSEDTRRALKEKREISSYLMNRKDGALILSKDEGQAVMVAAEDHIRIQQLMSGMNLEEAYDKVNKTDDYIDKHFDYAFDVKYGYKTTYPTNVGTGMRAGCTLHLPALSQAKKLSRLSSELGRFGVKFKALYDDGDGSLGNLYQVSNQKTLGVSESEIISDLSTLVLQVIEQEREQRNAFYESNKLAVEDEIYKSYGVVKYARKLNLRDAMTFLSMVMQGLSMGILTLAKDEPFAVNKILTQIQPAVLNDSVKRALSVEEQAEIRAEYLRKNIPDIV